MLEPSAQGQARTSIIIPSAGFSQPGANETMLDRCLETLRMLDPPPLEVIVVVGDEFQGELPRPIGYFPVQIVNRGPGSFDFSMAVNSGLLACRGELTLLLNDDIEAETSDWLGRMTAHLDDPTVGVVGAALVYPDRSIQHIGMEIKNGHPTHSFRGCPLSDAAAHGVDVARDVIGVTGACLLARRRDLLAVGALSPVFPASYGDIDLCLRLLRSGLRVVVEPAAILVHHESASREPVIEPWESERFVHRWAELADPWHHLRDHRPDYTGSSIRPMTADLVDGEDIEPLRHEILRLRDQALGADAENEHLRERFVNEDDRIAELEDRVGERDTRIEEWKDRVGERDARIAERDTRIAERDTRIAERDARIAELEGENRRLHEELARPAIIRLARRIVRGSRKNEQI